MPGWAFNAQKGSGLGVKRQNVHHSGRLTPGCHKREDFVFTAIFFQVFKIFQNQIFFKSYLFNHMFSKSISFLFQKYLLTINDLIQHFKYVAFSVEKGLMFESYLFLIAKSLIFKIKSFYNVFQIISSQSHLFKTITFQSYLFNHIFFKIVFKSYLFNI